MISRRRRKDIISLLLSLVLTILLTGIMVMTTLLAGVCREELYRRHVLDRAYHQERQEQIQAEIGVILTEAAIPLKVGQDVISENQVYLDAKRYIDGVLSQKEVQIDTTAMEEQLTENLEQHLTEQRLDLEEMQESTEKIVHQVVERYREMVSFPHAEQYIRYRTEIRSVLRVAYPVSLLIVAALVILLTRLHRRKHRAMRYMVYAVVASTVAHTLYAMHLQRLVENENPALSDVPYAQLMQGYLQDCMGQAYYVSLLGLIITVALLLGVQIRKKSKRGKR